MAARSFLALAVFAALMGLAGFGAEAQVPQSGLWEGELIPCNAAVRDSERLNGPQLFSSATDCAEDGRDFDALFLQIGGQIRSQTDMRLLQPLGDKDQIAVSELYRAIYLRLGGAGPRRLYSDQAGMARLFERLESWRPALPADYDPGWDYRPSERHALYAKVASEVAEGRLAQLRDYAELAVDPHYGALEGEIREIQARHPQGVPARSDDFKRLSELYREIDRIARERAIHQRALSGKQSVLAALPPELDEGVKRLFSGLNGPPKSGSRTFSTEDDARASWLARALTEDQLRTALASVDFTKEVLVAVYFGRKTTATGTVYFSGARYNALSGSWHVSGRIGVRDENCPKQEAVSHPFVLAVAPKPGGPVPSMGHGYSNFGDGCKPPVAGAATPE